MIKYLYLVMFINLLNTSCSSTGSNHSQNGCSDFLTDLKKKPDNVEFVGCTSEKRHQLQALKAVYKVAGKDAREVELALVQEFGLKPLKFACCGWESEPVSHVERNMDHFEVAMLSGETDEKDWNKIDKFTIRVYKLLELP